MSLYLLYRNRQWLGAMPAAIAVAASLMVLRTTPLKIEPVYDESAVQLAMVEPEPVSEPAPLEPPPPPVEEEPEAALPPPPKPAAKPEPKPRPKPEPTKPSAKPAPAQPKAVVAKPAPASPAPALQTAQATSAPAPAPAKPALAAPRVDSAALDGNYMQGLRSDIDRFKQYPTGRQASLERPKGDVVVWLLVDRAGNVLDSGIETPASSMLLNRAAAGSLKRIKQVKPFPEQAFGGRNQQRFTATFNYSVQ
ncbi:energy transducer TonB family protein [Pseudomonas sp. DC3200b2]|uniref:energy transducer TonB family protein n=1 Tax=Pseudomonas sp. DC3200b2 TaxID=2804669 RepID=UPI003CF9CBED